MSENIERIKCLIIGSGPAGYTAAIYAARADMKPVMYTGMEPGGQLTTTTEVDNFPGYPDGVDGPTMMVDLQKQAERFGTRILTQDVVSCDFSKKPYALMTSGGDTILAKSVIVATGATANWLGLENEMRLAMGGGGVSACAVCDGALPVYRDQPLAVVGGGDSALEEASYLTKFASEVFIIHRRDEFRASKAMQKRIFDSDKATPIWNKTVLDVLGEDSITGILLKDTLTGEESTLDVKGMFVAIGHTPATSILDGSGVELDDAGYIALHTRSSATNIEGVFAAGDVADSHYRQAISAAGMGCMAALDAEHFLARS